MPCYQPDNEIRTVYENGVDPNLVESEKRRNDLLNGMFCAVMSELDRRGIAEEVAAEASRNGLVDVIGYWQYHKEDDRSRIASKLHSFSKDEQRILLDLLKRSKL